MSDVNKIPLPLDQYQDYDIPQEYMAYIIEFKDISQMECDDLEYQYHIKGYKIFHTSLERSVGDLFNYRMIVAKSSMTFQK